MAHGLSGKTLWMVLLVGMLGVVVLPASVAIAQDAVAVAQDAAAVVTPSTDAADAGGITDTDQAADSDALSDLGYTINTLFMFICAVLVLFMQAGFAMLEVGLSQAKNTVNILAKNVMDVAIGVLLYLLIGFAVMYPGDNWLIEGVLGAPASFIERDGIGGVDRGGAYSNAVDFLFQAAFAAAAATIVAGAVAGRMKFVAYLVYSAIMTALIYPISGSWHWGGGWLAEKGFQDFAGSLLVHAVGGFAALAGAIVLGPRLGRFSADGKSIPIPGHNLTFAALGVFILWIGWYGFNPGSTLNYADAVSAEHTSFVAVTTTLSACAGAVAALLFSWVLFGKPDLTMALNGVLGGLVGITGNADRVSQEAALIIGLISGLLVVGGIVLLDRCRVDDPVGAWPVHGLCGLWGGLATGIFGELPDGIASTAAFVQVQFIGALALCGWAFSTMFLIFWGCKLAGILRVSAEEEAVGLDIAEHGMHAYPID